MIRHQRADLMGLPTRKLKETGRLKVEDRGLSRPFGAYGILGYTQGVALGFVVLPLWGL